MAISSELLTRSKLTGYVAILDGELVDPDKSDLDMDNIILREKKEDAIKDMVTRCYKTGFLQKELTEPKAFALAMFTFKSKTVVEGGKMAKYLDESPTGEIVYHASTFAEYVENNEKQYMCLAQLARQMCYTPLDGSIILRGEALTSYEVYEDEMGKVHISNIRHRHYILSGNFNAEAEATDSLIGSIFGIWAHSDHSKKEYYE